MVAADAVAGEDVGRLVVVDRQSGGDIFDAWSRRSRITMR